MLKKIAIINLLLLFLISLPLFAYQPQDVSSNHWALDYISPLLDEGIMYVYRTGDFKPNQAITRGEFAYSLAKALQLQPSNISNLKDINDNPAKGYISALVDEGIITGYPDQSFRAYNKITRAEIITMLGRALNLDDEQKKINLKDNYYFDVSNNHWANNLISVASRLNIINGYPNGEFRPSNNVTRAESAKLLIKLRDFQQVAGKIIETYPLSRKIKVKVKDQIITYGLAPNSLIGRNNRLVNLDQMLISDDAYLLVNEYGDINYLKSYGLITKEDIATKVSDSTNNFLSGEELVSIAEGDWQTVTPRLKQEVTMTLLDQGLTIQEVQALLNKEWDQLENLSKDRLIESVSMVTNVPRDIIEATSNKDWDLAKDLAKSTALKTVIKEVMTNSSLLS